MRLEPIEKPKGFMVRMAYWGTRRQFGKVMTPVSVTLARMPGLAKVMGAIGKVEHKGLRLDKEVTLLVAAQAAQINGCDFCLDLARWMALREQVGMEKVDALPSCRTSPLFSARERAALAYGEEITRIRKVSDTTFEELRKHFSERDIVEITFVNATENYYNLMNIPLGIGSDGLCAIAQAKPNRSARRSPSAARERSA